MNNLDRVIQLEKEIELLKSMDQDLEQTFSALGEKLGSSSETDPRGGTMNNLIRDQAQRKKPTIRF